MGTVTTKLTDLINPQVMADMISAKIPNKIVVSPFAKVDTTLVGQAGDTITVPQFAFIGEAKDVAEGVACESVKLSATTTTAKVKKVMQGVELTDEAVLSGYGNPVGEATSQLAKAVASKIDADCMAALQTAQVKYDGIKAVISYGAIVDAIDKFGEEFNSNKVMFINPAQVGTLRKDKDFIASDKLKDQVIVTGAIGKIANCEVVASKRVPEDSTSAGWVCPIVKLNADGDTEDDAPALTIYMKRNANVETDRISNARKTEVTVDEMYTAALSNSAKVVLATFKK